jgi:hypothetical protein
LSKKAAPLLPGKIIGIKALIFHNQRRLFRCQTQKQLTKLWSGALSENGKELVKNTGNLRPKECLFLALNYGPPAPSAVKKKKPKYRPLPEKKPPNLRKSGSLLSLNATAARHSIPISAKQTNSAGRFNVSGDTGGIKTSSCTARREPEKPTFYGL